MRLLLYFSSYSLQDISRNLKARKRPKLNYKSQSMV